MPTTPIISTATPTSSPTATATSTPSTSTATPPPDRRSPRQRLGDQLAAQTENPRLQRTLRSWVPHISRNQSLSSRGRRTLNLTMSASRRAVVAGWPEETRREFFRIAPITRGARQTILNEIRREAEVR